jgi:hypothetical protein
MEQQAAVEQANIAARAERREILRQEVAKIDKCDGTDSALVQRWLKDVELPVPRLGEGLHARRTRGSDG